MAKPLSNIQEVVELTLFHALREEVVSQGYLPDIMLYPNTSTGSTDYQTAIDTVRGSKGFCCEVFNNSNPDDKGLKRVPRIVLQSEQYLPGEIGGDGSREYVEHLDAQGHKYFSAHIRPPMTVDFTFNIHMICKSTQEYRVLNAMLANAIPIRGYLPLFKRVGLNTDDANIFIENISFAALPITSDGFSVMEYVTRYQVKDIFLLEFIKDLGNVAALQELTLTLQTENQRVLDTLTLT